MSSFTPASILERSATTTQIILSGDCALLSGVCIEMVGRQSEGDHLIEAPRNGALCFALSRAQTAEGAERQLGRFAERWDERYSTISNLRRWNWAQVIPFFAFPEEIRKVIYTTNAVESLNMSLRKAIRPPGLYENLPLRPSDHGCGRLRPPARRTL